jgi:hypothetical protein
MSVQAVLLPLFVQVALTFALLVWMAQARGAAMHAGAVRARDIALREPSWPPRATQIGNSYHNQLELPVLFYVLTILAWQLRHADLLFVVMAWIFVLLRLAQAYVHVTTNRVERRACFSAPARSCCCSCGSFSPCASCWDCRKFAHAPRSHVSRPPRP